MGLEPLLRPTWVAQVEPEFCTLRQWRGFQIGSNRFHVRMNLDFCHDKHELAKAIETDPLKTRCKGFTKKKNTSRP